MKKLYSLSILSCLSLANCFSQTSWQNYFTDATVKVEFKEIDHQESNTDINKKLIVFRLTNLTDKKISVNWKEKLQYGSLCYNCSGNNKELSFSIPLEPNSTIEGNPDSHDSNGLVILKKFNSPEIVKSKTPVLDTYELKNIEVLKAQ